jgi:peptide/nickel transport system permease protein
MYGGRDSLLAVLTAVLVYVVIGIPVGLLSGYLGGLADQMTARVCDLLMSVPAVVILLVVLGIFSNNETAAMIAFGFLASPGLIRIVRATTLAVRTEQFVAAARVAGLTTRQILRRHILPQVTAPAAISVSLMAGVTLIVESGLSFLGLGVQLPLPSWGGLIADASQAINRQAWMLVPSGGIVILTTMAFGLLGGAFRDTSADRAASPAQGPLSWRLMHTGVRRNTRPAQPTPKRSGALLSIHGLTITLPTPTGLLDIIDGISFDVAPGEALGIVGESGCGKTMAVAGLLRLLPPGGRLSADTYEFEGADLLALSDREMSKIRGRGIGYISQEPVASLDPAFSVGSQLAEAVRHHEQIPRRNAALRALELLRAVQLPDPVAVAKKFPHELSGGMAQRVCIARALAGNPKLLIADEPTTALDVTVQAEILDLLRGLREQTGMALILVTHDWGVLADACDRAVVLYAGEIVEAATVSELFRAPRHPYTAALLEANPEGVPRGKPLPAIPGTVPPPGRWPSGCRFSARCAYGDDMCRCDAIELITDGPDRAWRCIHSEKLEIRGDAHVAAPGT